MAEQVLITGAAGFVGRHLAAYLVEQKLQVHGLDRPSVHVPADWPGQWHVGDVTETGQIASVIQDVRPGYVFHLAALIKSSSLADLLVVNVIGTQNVLDAVAALRPEARVLVTGSAAEYGLVRPDELPIREGNALRPLGSYGVSKAAQGLLVIQYAYRNRLAAMYTRTFNLTGPGEPPGLVGGDLARRIVAVERSGPEGVIRVGNLAAERDFVDVRDAVRAYWQVCSQGVPGEVYNVCSGRSVQIERVLRLLVGYSTSRIQIQIDPELISLLDVPVSVGSAEKLNLASGWQSAIPLEESLRALLADCRQLDFEQIRSLRLGP